MQAEVQERRMGRGGTLGMVCMLMGQWRLEESTNQASVDREEIQKVTLGYSKIKRSRRLANTSKGDLEG